MNALVRSALALSVLAVYAGCVCTSGHSHASGGPPPGGGPEPVYVPPAPPAPPVITNYKYLGPHPIQGGGWDDTNGRHTHNSPPAPQGGYKMEGEWHVWSGPAQSGGGGNSAGTSTNRTPTNTGSGSSGHKAEDGDDKDRGRGNDKDKKDKDDKDKERDGGRKKDD